jgi:hypothetical protein
VAHDRPLRRAAASSFGLAFVLGTLGTSAYAILLSGKGLLEDLTLREDLTMVGVIVGLWLVLWPLFAAARRRSDRAEARDVGPIELPPRDPAEMTGRELADWARDDPDKLRRLIGRVRRQRSGGYQHRQMAGPAGAGDEISIRTFLRQLPWIALGLAAVVLVMWASGTEGLSLPWALLLWAFLTATLGPLGWLRGVRHTAPGFRKALGLAVLWALGVMLMVGIVYGLVLAVS